MGLLAHDRVGTLIAGRFRLQRVLGVGGMGVVYAALHEWTQRRVAVKLLRSSAVSGDTAVARFLREARAAARIAHRNVVDVLDMGQDEATREVYLVLELLEGTPLDQVLAERKRLSTDDTLEVLVPVMDALAVAHRRGIVHRDVKPDNVFLAEDERGQRVPKLLDFGVSKLLGDGGAKLTRTGVVLGTPEYMAPEQIRGEGELTPAADVWSMGVLLYECLSGALPFEGSSMTDVMARVLTAEPVPLAARAPDVPPALAAVVDRALSRPPEARQADMGELMGQVVRAAQPGGEAAGLIETQLSMPARPRVAPRTPTPPPASAWPEALDPARSAPPHVAEATAETWHEARTTSATHPVGEPAVMLPVSRAPLVAAGVAAVILAVVGGTALGVWLWPRFATGEAVEDPPSLGSAPATAAAPTSVEAVVPDPVATATERPPSAEADPDGASASGPEAPSESPTTAAPDEPPEWSGLSEREKRAKRIRKARRAKRRAERRAREGRGPNDPR